MQLTKNKTMKPELIIIFLLGLFTSFNVLASHIVGGELEMQHISDSTYKISMNLYRDDIYGIDINNTSMPVFIYSKASNALIGTLSLIRTTPLSEMVFVPYSNPNCTSISTSIRTEILKYSNTIKLSKLSYSDFAGYYVIWQSCCRNSSISNIINPNEAGMVFYLEFPPVTRRSQSFINSSP